MGRAKLEMQLISIEKSRHTTFKKRKEGLVRKLHEFTTLCDVKACMIIHPPKQQGDHEPHPQLLPEIWPEENPEQVSRLINLYKANNTGGGRNMGLSDFYHGRNKKIQEELEKKRKKRMEMVYPTWTDPLCGLSESQLRDFASGLGNKIAFVKRRLESMKGYINNKGSVIQRTMEWDHYHIMNPHEINHQPAINPSSSMIGLLMNEDENGNRNGSGMLSNFNIQYASFKNETVYPPPTVGVYGGYPMPSYYGYHGQNLLQPQPVQMGTYMQQQNMLVSRGMEYNDFFPYPTQHEE